MVNDLKNFLEKNYKFSMKCPILSYIKRSDRMDKYTKSILTVIAVGIIALNIQLFNGGGFFTKANALNLTGEKPQKVTICDEQGMECAGVSSYRLYTSG